MRLLFTSTYNTMYRDLSRVQQSMVDDTMELFVENPLSDVLMNHSLGGTMTGLSAISVDADLRIVFREKNDYTEITLMRV